MFGYFSLFANVTIMDSDDSARRTIFCLNTMILMCFNNDVLVFVPAMDLEALVMAGHVADDESLDSHLDDVKVWEGT